jgi:hypothetical protein
VDNDEDQDATPAVAAGADAAPPAPPAATFRDAASEQAEPSVPDGLKPAPDDKSWLEMMTVRDRTAGFWQRNTR